MERSKFECSIVCLLYTTHTIIFVPDKRGLRSLPMAAQEKMTNIPKTVWGVFENAKPPRLDVEELNNYAQAQRLLEEYHVLGENTLSPLGYADWLDDVTRCVSSGLKPMTQAECKKARSGFESDSTRFALNDRYDIWIGANLVEKVLLWQRNVDRSLAKVRGFTNPWTAETGPRLPKKGWQTDSWVLRNHIVEAWERMQEVPKPKEIMPRPGGSGAIVSREQGGRETEKNLEQEIKPAVTIQHFVLFNNNPNRVEPHVDASQLVMHVEARQFLALAPDASDLVKKGHAYCNKRSLFATRGTIQTPLMYKQVDDKLDFAHRYYCVTASGQTSSISNISPGAGSDLPEVEKTKEEQLKRLQHDGIKYCEGHKQEGKKETCAASYCKFEMQYDSAPWPSSPQCQGRSRNANNVTDGVRTTNTKPYTDLRTKRNCLGSGAVAVLQAMHMKKRMFLNLSGSGFYILHSFHDFDFQMKLDEGGEGGCCTRIRKPQTQQCWKTSLVVCARRFKSTKAGGMMQLQTWCISRSCLERMI